jgi:hypothetical protein
LQQQLHDAILEGIYRREGVVREEWVEAGIEGSRRERK